MQFKEHPCQNQLLTTGSDVIPVEVTIGLQRHRCGITHRYEESDVVIVIPGDFCSQTRLQQHIYMPYVMTRLVPTTTDRSTRI